MSAENTEVMRRWLAALSAGSAEAVAAVGEFWDADADFYPVRKSADAQPCHGHQEIAEFMARYWDTYTVSDWVLHDVIPVGDDRVLAYATVRAEGRSSRIELESDIYLTVWLRHGRFLRLENHLTPRGAIHSLGLEGETLEAAGLVDHA